MKHGKVPTRNQKELMLKNNLNPKEWLVVKKMADGFEIVNREIMDTKPALIFYFDFAMPKST